MACLVAWMGAGAVAAGVSAAMIAGADVASADTTSGSDASTSGTSADASNDRDRPDSKTPSGAAEDSSGPDSSDGPDASDGTDADDPTGADDEAETGDESDTHEIEVGADDNPQHDVVDTEESSGSVESELPLDEAPAESEPIELESAPATTDDEDVPSPAEAPVITQAALPNAAPPQVKSADLRSISTAAAPQVPSLPDLIQSFIFDVIGVAVTFVAGPPVVPPGSKVTVRSSWLDIAEGRTVPADWYYPDGDEPPQRLIYLQHGFLGVGAMYSYTAAYLAESTNSVVVVPTLSSNRFVQGGFWLGDDQAYRATAELLLGDREALTASAVAAGFAEKYGTGVRLPDTFVLVGHSLGGGLVAGVAGYYADAVIASGAVNHLAGVVLLDAAPPGTVLPDALDKLDGLGAYIPVLELGAPKESRRVDAALNEHRPGRFNGVILTGGKHLDAMQGGTPLIQFISHLYQGFPTPQNQLAAQTLIAGWTDDIFAGRIDASTGKCEIDDCAGIYGDLGQTIALETTAGPTSAVVIGKPVAPSTTEFQPVPATALVAPRAPVGKSLLLRV